MGVPVRVRAMLDDPHAVDTRSFIQRLLTAKQPTGWGVGNWAVKSVVRFRHSVRAVLEAALASSHPATVLIKHDDEIHDAWLPMQQCKRSCFVHDNGKPVLHDACVKAQKTNNVVVIACCKHKPPELCKCERYRVCAECSRRCSLCAKPVCEECEKMEWVDNDCVCKTCRCTNEFLADLSSDSDSDSDLDDIK